jgi:hypothetical protein
MNYINQTIYTALNSCLITAINGRTTSKPPVISENVLSEGYPDLLYLETYLLPARPRQIALGKNGLKRYTGTFQVTIVDIKDIGTQDAFEFADWLQQTFEAFDTITSGTTNIGITVVYPTQGFNGTQIYRQNDASLIDRFRIPVNIEYYSYQ